MPTISAQDDGQGNARRMPAQAMAWMMQFTLQDTNPTGANEENGATSERFSIAPIKNRANARDFLRRPVARCRTPTAATRARSD
jgi:hypothetical protein